jgi:hypothetical protein
MRKILCVLIAGSLPLAWTGTVRSGTDDARAIVNKAIEAMGGEANLTKHRTATWREKGTYYGMGDGLPYTSSLAIQWPDQFRMTVDNVFTIVVNGDKGWIKDADGTKELPRDQLALQKHNLNAGWITSLWPLKDKEFQLKAIGEAKVGKHLTQVVEVKRKGYPDVKLYFDKTTHLRVMSEFRTKSPEQKFQEVTQQMHFSDFRDVDGAKTPHKIVLKRDGKLFVEAEILDLKVADKLGAKMFARPGE